MPPSDDISWRYEIEITESDGSSSQTTHQVTMDKNYYMDLTENGRIIPEEFIKSFEFLSKNLDMIEPHYLNKLYQIQLFGPASGLIENTNLGR